MPLYKGKTTAEAIEKGLKDLGIEKKNAKIEIKTHDNQGIFGLFANEAEVSIRELSKKELQRKKYQRILSIVGGVIVALVFVCIIIFSNSSQSSSSSEARSNLIALPIESKDIDKKNYKVVVSQLKDAGFTNVKTEKIEDLITGWITKDGQIESVSIQGETEFVKGKEIPKDTQITVSYHTFKEESEEKENSSNTQSSSSSSLSSSSSSASSAEKSTAAPSTNSVTTIIPENNPEFAAILQTEDPTAIAAFVQKYQGKTVEFNAYIAYLNTNGSYKTRYDILIYAGDYPGPDVASPGPSFQFNNIAPTSVFKNFSGDGVGVGQNMHIKAAIKEFTKGELLILEPLEVTER